MKIPGSETPASARFGDGGVAGRQAISGGDTPNSWRDSNWLAVIEFLLVIAIFIADWHHLIPVSKTPFLLVLGWISLRLRHKTWHAIGLRKYRTWPLTLRWGVVAGILLEAFQLFISQPLLMRMTKKPPDLHDFAALAGNLKLTLLFISLAWTLAAFGEEMVWRGYLMNRVADVIGNSRNAWIVSLLLVHAGFGLAHSYQGITGIIDEGLAGLLLGVLYLVCGRNLAVPIIAHGVSDTIDFLLIFAGKYPTM
jgi:CAAX protease family protein